MKRLCWAALWALGCGTAPFEARTTRGVYDPASEDFWARPLPSDLREEADGSYDLPRWPSIQESDVLVDWFRAADVRLRGWGVSAGTFLPLSGPIDESTLPASPADSLRADASVFIIDIDPGSPERGRRFPINAVFLKTGDRYTQDNTLAANPVFGFLRRPLTKYATVVTRAVLDQGGEPLGRSEAFHLAFEGAGAFGGHFNDLKDTLKAEGIDPAGVSTAAIFTTGDPNADILALVEWAEAHLQPALTQPWTLVESHESYEVLEAKTEVPVIQAGERPYTGINQGAILWEGGAPKVLERQEIRLVLAVPRASVAPQPAAGYPLMFYLHGSGGEAYQFVNRGPVEERPPGERGAPEPGKGPAEWLARRGVASFGFDFPLHGARHNPPDTTGLIFYNLFGNMTATLDNFRVAAMETTILSKLMLETTVDPALSPALEAGEAADGLIRFDPARFTGMGQSQGSYIGAMWAAVDPRVKGFFFSGAGGIVPEIAVEAVEPVRLQGIANIALRLDGEMEGVHINHPVLHAAQHLFDLVDPVVKARHVQQEPFEGYQRRHILMSAGLRDGYFHPRSQAAYATALGAPPVGATPDETITGTLELAGLSALDYPVSGNKDGYTAGLLQYEAPYTLGHYVAFNQVGARYQWTCFIATVGTEGGPVINAPQELDAPCR